MGKWNERKPCFRVLMDRIIVIGGGRATSGGKGRLGVTYFGEERPSNPEVGDAGVEDGCSLAT